MGIALYQHSYRYIGSLLPSILSLYSGKSWKMVMGVADAAMYADDREIYVAKDLRVGLFTSTEDF